jgi:competence protein ComEC
VDRISTGPSVKHPKVEGSALIDACRRGDGWEWDGVQFEILHPVAGAPQNDSQSENNSSCVLRISGDGGNALLLGDIERAAENGLVEQRLIGKTNVVVVPHHGSRTSSTQEFVAACSPSVAVVSAGYGNRWGFPKEDVVARWRAMGAEVLNTADSGAIEIHIGSPSASRIGGSDRAGPIFQYRRLHRTYWQHPAVIESGSLER